MDDTPTEPLPINVTTTHLGSSRPARQHRVWRLLAIGAGVALVPASIAVATSSSTPTSTSTSTPTSTPTSVSTPDVTAPVSAAPPQATVPTVPDDHGGHGELEPGDDRGANSGHGSSGGGGSSGPG